MIYLLAFGFTLLILVAIYSILAPFRRKHPQWDRRWYTLVYSKTFFILGFIYFQIYGAAYYALMPWDFGYLLIDNDRAYTFFLGYATLFLAVFFWVYRRVLCHAAVPKFLVFESEPSLPPIWIVAVIVSVLSLLLRFSGNVPFLGPALNHWLSLGSAVACGIAAFAWGRGLFNPISIAVLLFTAGVGLVNTLATDFGRRNLLAQALTILVCLWVSGYRSGRARQTAVAVVVMGAVGLAVLTAFTQARQDRVAERSDRINFLFSEFSPSSMVEFAIPGDTAPASLWLIDSHPKRRGFETETLFTVRYFFWHYAPRALFPNKPDPLSLRIPFMAQMRRVNLGTLTIGPGLVGHIAHDGGWWVAIVYGGLLGTFFGFIDKFLDRNILKVFALPAVVCAYAQFFGLPRGESSVFLGIAVIGLVGWVSSMSVVDSMMRQLKS